MLERGRVLDLVGGAELAPRERGRRQREAARLQRAVDELCHVLHELSRVQGRRYAHEDEGARRARDAKAAQRLGDVVVAVERPQEVRVDRRRLEADLGVWALGIAAHRAHDRLHNRCHELLPTLHETRVDKRKVDAPPLRIIVRLGRTDQRIPQLATIPHVLKLRHVHAPVRARERIGQAHRLHHGSPPPRGGRPTPSYDIT